MYLFYQKSSIEILVKYDLNFEICKKWAWTSRVIQWLRASFQLREHRFISRLGNLSDARQCNKKKKIFLIFLI